MFFPTARVLSVSLRQVVRYGGLLLLVGVSLTSAHSEARIDDALEAPSAELAHAWTLHDGKHWQVASPDGELPEDTDRIEQTRGACPAGMVEVRGRWKLDPWLDWLQRSVCTQWISEEFPERCAEFDREGWLALVAAIPTVAMRFCIDRYEYPNIKGQYPWVLVTWPEASDICRKSGKRLCSEDEWTFACEGEDAEPYPYGFVRSAEACVIDRPWQDYDEHAFADRASEGALRELDRIWQGEPSGSHLACRSPFGVYDMTGNVDEWTHSTSAEGYRSILKGGYWGPVRNRCRPSTRAHGEGFAFYQQGFRCCSDVPKR